MSLHHKLASALGYQLIRKKNAYHHFDIYLEKLLNKYPISVVLDVGANRGQFVQKLRNLKYKNRIISFEPGVAAFTELQAIAKIDPLLQIHRYAIGNQKGYLDLNVTDSTDLSSFLKPNEFAKNLFKSKVANINAQCCEIKLLKDIIETKQLQNENILLKSDTQGFDLEVLKGLGEYIEKPIMIILELSFKPIYSNMPKALEVISFLDNHGFKPSGFFPISRDASTLELIEMDGIFLNQRSL